MNHIYIQAYVTIVAGSDNAWTGLPGVSRVRRSQRILQLGDVRLISIPEHRDELPWNRRAWTFQEGCLSRRMILFEEEERTFICQAMFCPESIVENPPPCVSEPQYSLHDFRVRGYVPSVYDHLSVKGSIHAATSLLEAYCPRALSYSGDALNACLGILNAAEITHSWGVPIERSEIMK